MHGFCGRLLRDLVQVYEDVKKDSEMRIVKIGMAHGSGGRSTDRLIKDIFIKNLGNEVLNKLEDSAVLDMPWGRIAFATDSFVVKPLFFSGGDIGKLSVCGTVNDLLMAGAVPKYMTCAFIIEEGLEIELLDRIAHSMKEAAEESGVVIAAGDTKVIEGSGGLYINTSGLGIVEEGINISASGAKPGDAVLLSGSLGNHHASILSHRMGIKNNIKSDCAPLREMVSRLIAEDIRIRAMRDVTRGGLGTVLNEIAESSEVSIEIIEDKIKVDKEVRGFCDILGLDPLYMGNEGKLVCFTAREDAERALQLIKSSKYGDDAEIIGYVEQKDKVNVTLATRLGGKRIVDVLTGEGLPRIC